MKHYDLAVIGGGINGCGIARDAAGRGLSVLLAEQSDLAAGTSSASTKMIHGGLRYLEHCAFHLVRESLKEREVLMRIAPHITRPLQIILPHIAAMRPAWLIRCGLFLYDHLAPAGGRSLPRSQKVSLRNTAIGAPLRGAGAASAVGFTYADCWVDDARLVIINAVDAARRGAVILPRTACVAAVADGADGGHWQLTLQPKNAATFKVRCRCLVNAAGPWANIFLQRIGQPAAADLRLVQGSHIVVPRLYDGEQAYLLQNRDGRIIFVAPYQQHWTLVGTTDRDFIGDPTEAAVSDAETDYLCRALNFFFGKMPVADDIVRKFCGVRPLAAGQNVAAQNASRDYAVRLQKTPAPLLNIIGGKLTTYRKLAETAVNTLCGKDGIFAPAAAWTAGAVLPGGDLPPGGVAAVADSLTAQHPRLSPQTATRLARAYGSEATAMPAADEDVAAWQNFGAGLHRWEADYLIKNEWAMTAEDILWRRGQCGLAMSAAATAQLTAYMQKTVAANTQCWN